MTAYAARFVTLAWLAVTFGAAAAAAQTRQPFDPVGRWRFYHTDGTPFLARLTADQIAQTDWEGGEHGIWRWEGNAVRIMYTDGWDDFLLLKPDGKMAKRGWAPDADRCAVASNETAADRLAADPGPPLPAR